MNILIFSERTKIGEAMQIIYAASKHGHNADVFNKGNTFIFIPDPDKLDISNEKMLKGSLIEINDSTSIQAQSKDPAIVYGQIIESIENIIKTKSVSQRSVTNSITKPEAKPANSKQPSVDGVDWDTLNNLDHMKIEI